MVSRERILQVLKGPVAASLRLCALGNPGSDPEVSEFFGISTIREVVGILGGVPAHERPWIMVMLVVGSDELDLGSADYAIQILSSELNQELLIELARVLSEFIAKRGLDPRLAKELLERLSLSPAEMALALSHVIPKW